ncbi:S8 family serine peptidase [Actinomadura sp. 7K507]|uniref:S8 family serine peptidase n=1 Tax=Actinomadura sp. 7K507 TaxID=2530365 RepID=UPI001FB5D429|nr:S8 family serine peptidase [Actinomadura sp. 7K507]
MLTGGRMARRHGRTARTRTVAAVFAAALAGTWLVPVPAHADEVRDRQRPILDALGMDAAWKVSKGKGVTVAVVDSGVDANQADLAGSVTTGPNMLEEVDDGSAPTRRHGTGMASLIAGHGHGSGGGDGIIGMAPESRVLSVRAISEPEDPGYVRYRLSEDAEGAVARGIRHAADKGADVINLSLGKNEEVPEERAAIGYAIGKGVVVVSAVGNDGNEPGSLDGDGFAPYSYPASYPGVIAVAATEGDNSRAPFSNRNFSVLLSAPGAGLPVAGPGDEYFVSSGTSGASAVVSGIAALIRAKYPDMAPALVSQALIDSTKHGPSGEYNAEVGFGMVHASRALSAAGALESAGSGGAKDKAAGQRFGADDPGPVEVIERPAWVTPLIIALVAAGIGGTITAGAISMTFRRRHPRPAVGPPAGPQPVPAGGPRPVPPRGGPYGPPPGQPQGRPQYGPPPGRPQPQERPQYGPPPGQPQPQGRPQFGPPPGQPQPQGRPDFDPPRPPQPRPPGPAEGQPPPA